MQIVTNLFHKATRALSTRKNRNLAHKLRVTPVYVRHEMYDSYGTWFRIPGCAWITAGHVHEEANHALPDFVTNDFQNGYYKIIHRPRDLDITIVLIDKRKFTRYLSDLPEVIHESPIVFTGYPAGATLIPEVREGRAGWYRDDVPVPYTQRIVTHDEYILSSIGGMSGAPGVLKGKVVAILIIQDGSYDHDGRADTIRREASDLLELKPLINLLD